MNCWVFNIGIEKEWTLNQFQIRNREEDVLTQHMEEIMLLLAKKEDIVLMRRQPDNFYIEDLTSIGLEIPRILCPKEENLSLTVTELVLKDEKLLRELTECARVGEINFLPYGVTEREEQLAKICGMKLCGSRAEITYKTNSKLYARELAQKLGLSCPMGYVCQNREEIERAWQELRSKFQRVIVKQIYGTSGQGLYLVDNEKSLQRVLHIVKRSSSQNTAWIVEGWYEEKLDVNAQLFIGEKADIKIFSMKEQVLQETVYKGSIFPLDERTEKVKQYKRELKKVGKALYQEGVRGVVGIDSIFTEQEVYSVIEINVRFTLSTYLSGISTLFPNRYFMTYYYRIPLISMDLYSWLQKQLQRQGLNLTKEKGEGIFFYNPSCMKKELVGNMGRLFVVMVGKKRTVLWDLQKKLEALLREVKEIESYGKDNS